MFTCIITLLHYYIVNLVLELRNDYTIRIVPVF